MNANFTSIMTLFNCSVMKILVRVSFHMLLNHFDSKLTNAVLEGLNISIVQSARNRAKGYISVETFKMMVFLLVGKLNHAIQ